MRITPGHACGLVGDEVNKHETNMTQARDTSVAGAKGTTTPPGPRPEPRPETTKRVAGLDAFLGNRLWLALFSILGSLVAIALLVGALFQASPILVVTSLFEGAVQSRAAITRTVVEAVPILLAGLAVWIPFRAGFLNIGGQGQLVTGALVSVVIATRMDGPAIVVITVSLLGAMLTGAAGAIIPLLLKIRFGAHEVPTTLMMSFASLQLVYALMIGVLQDERIWYGGTHAVPEIYRLPAIPGTSIHIGALIALIIALTTFWIVSRTVYGAHLTAVGYNRDAAIASGIRADRIMIKAVLSGAALAGLAGGIQILGVTGRVAEGWAKPWGFTGITVAFLGGNPVGAIPISGFLAILDTGARHMQTVTGVPSALVHLFHGIPVLAFVGLLAYRQLRAVKA